MESADSTSTVPEKDRAYLSSCKWLTHDVDDFYNRLNDIASTFCECLRKDHGDYRRYIRANNYVLEKDWRHLWNFVDKHSKCIADVIRNWFLSAGRRTSQRIRNNIRYEMD